MTAGGVTGIVGRIGVAGSGSGGGSTGGETTGTVGGNLGSGTAPEMTAGGVTVTVGVV